MKEGFNRNNYLKAYVENMELNDRSKRTIETYRNNVILFINYFNESNIDQFNPSLVSEIDIKEFRQHCLMNLKNSPSTVNLKLASLRSYFEFLIEEKLVSKNPAKRVKKVKTNSVKSSLKTFDEKTYRALRRLYYRYDNKLHICIFELLTKTGLRASELCHLKMNDIDLNLNQRDSRNGFITVHGKGRFRKIPLHKDARTALYDWVKMRNKRKIEEDYLLVSERKGPFTPSGIRNILRKYQNMLDLPQSFGVHAYRHYFATALINAGESIEIVAKLMGHSSSSITSSIYVQPNLEDLEESIEKLK